MNTKAVGERIQIAREEQHMTQLELAKKIGCTSQHISVTSTSFICSDAS